MLSQAGLEDLRSAREPALWVSTNPKPVPGRVALLAASFDPPTSAHAALAGSAGVEADLVVLVYALHTLPKSPGVEPPLLDEPERLAALEALGSATGAAIGIVSHGLLVDHVRAAHRPFPDARFDLVMGSDKALQLLDPRWYEDRDAALTRMFERARVRYAERAGDEGRVARALAAPEHRRWAGFFSPLQLPSDVASISSSAVRARARAGRSIDGWVPEAALPLVRAAAAREG